MVTDEIEVRDLEAELPRDAVQAIEARLRPGFDGCRIFKVFVHRGYRFFYWLAPLVHGADVATLVGYDKRPSVVRATEKITYHIKLCGLVLFDGRHRVRNDVVERLRGSFDV